MANTVEYRLTADEGKVVDAMRRVTGSMKEAEAAGEKLNRKQKEQSTGFEGLTGKVKEFGAGIASLAAGYATFEGLKSLLDSYVASLERGAEKQKTIGAGLRQLAQDTPGGSAAMQKRLEESAGRGKAAGISPDQMAQIDDWAGDVAGRFGEAVVKDLASREVTLEKIGFDPEATKDAMAALVKQGIAPEEASRMVVGAFMNTDLKPSTMAKIPTAIEKFASPQEGLAVAAGMADMGIYTSKELPGKVAEVGNAFAKGGKIEKYLRRQYENAGQDYDAASTEEKLANLQALGFGSEKKLKSKFKLSDSEAETMKAVMDRAGAIGYARKQIADTPAGIAEAQLGEMKKTPAMESFYGGEQAKAAADYAATFGMQAEGNRRFEKRRAEIGKGLLESKDPLESAYGRLAVDDNGLAGKGTTYFSYLMDAMAPLGAIGGPGGNPGIAMQHGAATPAVMSETTAKEMAARLAENTEATRANTAATQTGAGNEGPTPSIAQRRNR